MAQRPGIVTDVAAPAEGGESPNAYVPWVSAQVRANWPPRATWDEIQAVIWRAYVQAVEDALERYERDR